MRGHAIVGITKAYCDELAQYNVQVNGIASGYFEHPDDDLWDTLKAVLQKIVEKFEGVAYTKINTKVYKDLSSLWKKH